MTIEEAREIILAELRYWKSAPDTLDLPSLGAIGALSNVLCAIDGIHRAPWHPQTKEEPCPTLTTSSNS